MPKKVETQIKLQIQGGAATPAPPIGPALGQHGINISEFVSQFNDRTSDRRGELVPVVITVYKDRSFDFITKTAPASEMIKNKLGIDSGAGNPLTDNVGTLSRQQLEEIAKKKMPDLNTNELEPAMRIVAGTAKQMGVSVDWSK
jgi:large subunit ribosomal protein L11